MTPARHVACALALALLTSGCAAVRLARSVEVPERGRLYVAPFVDETRAGEVGVRLADAVKLELFRRDPALLSVVFDEESVALDGTVLALDEARAEGGRYSLRIRASALLVNRDGEQVADLGRVEARASYALSRDPRETEEARARALEDAMRALARELLRRVDRAGREERASEEASRLLYDDLDGVADVRAPPPPHPARRGRGEP